MSVAESTVAAIRFGYGFRPGEAPPAGAEALIRQLRQGARAGLVFDLDPMQERAEKLKAFRQARRTDRTSTEFRELRKGLVQLARWDGPQRLLQRALSPHGFYERLTAFWADHFSVSVRSLPHRILVPTFEVEAIRPHIMGNFADMLVASSQHSIMLHYLNQPQSFGPNSPAGLRRNRGLNENLAREILELHTLGVGGPYTQRDVREFAELLTGYTAQLGGEFLFLTHRAEPGAETVLGRSYGGEQPSADDAVAFLHDLARHPATARHIALKLAVHFVADDPPEDLVAHLEQAFRRGDGRLPRVYEALVEHPAAWEQFGRKVKRPIELVVSTWRALGLNRRVAEKNGELLAREAMFGLRIMGQPVFAAPGPDGWPEAAADWITPQGLAARIKWISKVARFVAKRRDIDPRRFAERTLGDALRPETMSVVSGAPERWEGIAFTLASPEFNRR